MSDDLNDVFTRTEYRRVIAWPERIRREAPFLEAVLGSGEPKRFLDLGCGTGEHSRHFAELGWTAVGIDISEKMIEDANELAGTTAAGGSARFERRDIAAAGELPEAPFGAALCVGNTLAFSFDEEELDRVFGGVAGALAPGARLLLQMLNYDRLESSGARHLPLNFRELPAEEGEGEILFLRVLKPSPDGLWDFYPVTLTLKPGEDPPVVLRSARAAKHRAWRRADLEAGLTRAGFGNIRVLGGMAGEPYLPRESPDLVLVAERSA